MKGGMELVDADADADWGFASNGTDLHGSCDIFMNVGLAGLVKGQVSTSQAAGAICSQKFRHGKLKISRNFSKDVSSWQAGPMSRGEA